MASIPNDFLPPDNIGDDTNKVGDTEVASTESESVHSSSNGEDAVLAGDDGFQPSDDSSGQEDQGSDEEASEDMEEEVEGPEDNGGSVDSESGSEGGGDDEESFMDEGNGHDEDVDGDDLDVDEEPVLAPNQDFINQGNGGAIDGGIGALQGEDDDVVDEEDDDDDANAVGQNAAGNFFAPNMAKAIVRLPDEQLQRLGITQGQLDQFPIAQNYNFDVAVAMTVSLGNQARTLGLTTYPLLHAAMKANKETWIDNVSSEVGRFMAASSIRIEIMDLELYRKVVPELVERFATGDIQAVNCRARMEEAGELVEPMPARLRNIVLGVNANGGVNGG